MVKRFLAAAALGLLMTSGAQAGVTLDTVTGLTQVDIAGPGSDGSNIMATSVSIMGMPVLNSISLLLSADQPPAGGSVKVYLVPDSNGPIGFAGASSLSSGVLLGTIPDTQLADSSGGSALVTLSTFPNPLVSALTSANGKFWIALDMTGSAGEWAYDAGGPANQSSYSDANGLYSDAGTTLLPDGVTFAPGAFAVIVDAPEPATIALLGAGLAGLGYVRRRKASST